MTAGNGAVAAAFFCTDGLWTSYRSPPRVTRPWRRSFFAASRSSGRASSRRSRKRASHGDLSENAEYHSAKEAQSHNEGRIVELEDLLQRAEVIDVAKLNGATVKFGATVTLIDEDTEKQRVFQIVGESEADVKSGKMSITSPTGRALIGKKVGDSVEVNTPGGGKSYEIVKVAFI